MSRDVQQNLDKSSIDAILKSLTNRPNVQSTLILSRRDGSIIRATGFPQQDSSSGVLNHGYGRTQASEQTDISNITPEGYKSEDSTIEPRESFSPTQDLASAIYEFVSISSRLASSMSRAGTSSAISAGDLGHSRNTQSSDQGLDQLEVSEIEDIQLLRMRTKRQEIIIFPDPNYLCCVVQNIVKHTGRSDLT